MLIKQSITSQKFRPRNFGKLPIVFSTKVNLLYVLYSTAWRYCLLLLIKRNCLLKNFLKNYNSNDSHISLPLFPSRTNLKLNNISITPKMVQKLIMNLDFLKTSGANCILVVVLKNCKPELPYILVELFNKCMKKSCFPDCWEVSLVVPVFKNVGEWFTVKSYHPVSLLSVVSKVFEKLVFNTIVDHLVKCGRLSDLEYDFRSSQSTKNIITVLLLLLEL